MKAIVKNTGETVDVIQCCAEEWIETKSDTIGKRVFQRDALILDEPTDWASFRREAAKDILCAIISTRVGANPKDVTTAIETADELIKQLKEK